MKIRYKMWDGRAPIKLMVLFVLWCMALNASTGEVNLLASPVTGIGPLAGFGASMLADIRQAYLLPEVDVPFHPPGERVSDMPDFRGRSGEEMTMFFEVAGQEDNIRDKEGNWIIYKDSEGYATIGYGINLDETANRWVWDHIDNGRLSEEEALVVFRRAYRQARERAMDFIGPAFHALTPHQQNIVVDMAYNIGGFENFTGFREAILEGDTARQVRELREGSCHLGNNRWYYQTGRRADHHIKTWSEEYKPVTYYDFGIDEIREYLREAGFYGGSADGAAERGRWGGEVLRGAVRDFQEHNGLTVDGKAGPRTIQHMFNDSIRSSYPGA